MSKYPEHEKLQAREPDNRVVSEFLDWLDEKWLEICCDSGIPGGGYTPAGLSKEDLIGEFFGVDPKRLELEKQAMLREIRTRGLCP